MYIFRRREKEERQSVSLHENLLLKVTSMAETHQPTEVVQLPRLPVLSEAKVLDWDWAEDEDTDLGSWLQDAVGVRGDTDLHVAAKNENEVGVAETNWDEDCLQPNCMGGIEGEVLIGDSR